MTAASAAAMTNSQHGLLRGCAPTGHDPCEGVSATGAIVTGVHRSKVSSEFESVIQATLDRVAGMSKNISVYAYGSVVTGMARTCRSDVDFIAVGLEPEVALAIGSELSEQYGHVCRGVDVGPAQKTDYERADDESYGNRVFLRHYAVHLAGPDIRTELAGFESEFAADAAAARGFNGDIALAALRWRTSAQAEPQPPALGRRIARKTLVALAGLVSVHDATWTTDRLAAARRWARLRPEHEAALAELVCWSSEPNAMPTSALVHEHLDGIVAGVVDEFASRIGLWT